MSKDGTWQHEIGEKDQIIALTTKVAKLQMKLDKQVIALATKAKIAINPPSKSNANSRKRHGKKDGPYTVAEWCLVKKEATFASNGKMYHWCTGDYNSGGTKYTSSQGSESLSLNIE